MFSERIKKRWALWWGPQQSRGFHAGKELIHRLKERYTFRNRNDAEQDWQCCESWQRTLSFKWNAREFAQKHGCSVPKLYWFGRRVRNLDLDSLPEHYVVRPNLGFARRGVYVIANGTNLLSQVTYTKPQLREQLRQTTGNIFGLPILVEEFITTEDGEYRLPTEYKYHVFGETVGAIQVLQRSSNKRDTKHRFYTEQWELIEDQMSGDLPLANYIDPPRCLEEMSMLAKRLGKAYDTYVRADFYSSERGCVFGEFASTPAGGRGFTKYADEYFGGIWQENLADKI